MKAGLIEIADVMVVNKADREGADRAAHQLKGALSLRAADRVPGAGAQDHGHDRRRHGGAGRAIDEAGARAAAGPPQERRRRRARYLIARAAADLIAERIKSDAAATSMVWPTTCCPAASCRPTPPGS